MAANCGVDWAFYSVPRISWMRAKLYDNVQGLDSVSTCRCFVSPCPGLLGLFLASWFSMWAALQLLLKVLTVGLMDIVGSLLFLCGLVRSASTS